MTGFDPSRLLETLQRHRVRFVVIGGLAGRLHGSPTLTNDLDICYARDDANLEALSAALRELSARLRGADPNLPFQVEARTLRAGDHFTFATDAGNLDILGLPAGTSGFNDLIRTAETMELPPGPAPVASLDDLIRMKRCADRPKDRIEIEILSALRDEIEQEGE